MIGSGIFKVTAKQIASLDDDALVDLLRRLLHAEARSNGLPLGGVHVPAQITIPDGGEDGRMSWIDGADHTDYLPRRFIAFQARATGITEAKLIAETHAGKASRGSRKKAAAPALRPVLVDAVASGGAYLVVTTKPLTTRQKKPLIKAIKKGISSTGHDPDVLTIDIYDANKLAAWATHHQAVALEFNERLGGHSLAGFKSITMWERREDFHSIAWSDDGMARLMLAPVVLPVEQRTDRRADAWTFDQAQACILHHLAELKRGVRISGASGLGKSRFAYAVFTVGDKGRRAFDNAAVVYAEYDVVGDAVVQLAERYAQSGLDVVLVVDDCPDRVHQRLLEAATQDGSRLRLVTINVESKAMPAKDRLLTVEIGASSSELIEAIVAQVDPGLDARTRQYIGELAHGFPRMAVQGARAAADGRDPIGSAQELVERIVWGRRSPDFEAMRALEAASLFEVLRIAGNAPTDLAAIAPHAAEMTVARMREHLLSFAERGIVVKKGRFIQIQPLPLAVILATRRLAALGPDGAQALYANLPDHLKMSLLDRLRWVDGSPEAQSLTRWLLSPDGIGTRDAINTDFGARIFDRLVHVLPDEAMDTLNRVLGSSTRQELETFSAGRRHVVWALGKLVFRRQTFDRAARLLLRLAAAETERQISNNATGAFKRLYQLHLSGTEASPSARLAVLDHGLASSDSATRQIAIEAAGTMLETTHFLRSGGAEQIGSRPPLVDWHPNLRRDVWDFHAAGLERLEKVALGSTPEALAAQRLIGTHVRGLLSAMPFDRLAPTLRRIAQRVGVWEDAVQGISDWLYFDRRKSSDGGHAAQVRALFDELMPADLVDLILLHASGWGHDIHHPDQTYDSSDRTANDHSYSEREFERVAPLIAAEPETLRRCFAAAVSLKLDSGFALGKALARHVADPQRAFRTIIDGIEGHGSLADSRFVRGFLAGIDARDPALARACAIEALSSPTVGSDALGLMQGLTLRADDVPLLVDLVEKDRIDAGWSSHISYGRGLANIAPDALAPLLDALIAKGPNGCWSALDIMHMVLMDHTDLPSVFAERIKTILLTPGLIENAARHTRDPYLLNGEIKRLARHDIIDAPFARAFVRQLMRVNDIDFSLQLKFEHYTDEMLQCLISKAPAAVWEEIAERLENETETPRHGRDRLLEPDRDDRTSAGVLFQLPAELYLGWVRKEQDQRAQIVATWIPLTEPTDAGGRTWHPALLSFLDEFADANRVLEQISWRSLPMGGWGSPIPDLESWLPLLDQLSDHSNSTVSRWAMAAREGVVRQIETKRNEDAEREISSW